MKITWEGKDVRAGRRVRTPGAKEVFIIGFDPTKHGEKTPAFALISLSDGMICGQGESETTIQFAEYLNRGGYAPVELVGESA